MNHRECSTCHAVRMDCDNKSCCHYGPKYEKDIDVDSVTKLRRLEKRLWDKDLVEAHKKSAYIEILSLVTRKWQERVKQLEDEIQRLTGEYLEAVHDDSIRHDEKINDMKCCGNCGHGKIREGSALVNIGCGALFGTQKNFTGTCCDGWINRETTGDEANES